MDRRRATLEPPHQTAAQVWAALPVCWSCAFGRSEGKEKEKEQKTGKKDGNAEREEWGVRLTSGSGGGAWFGRPTRGCWVLPRNRHGTFDAEGLVCNTADLCQNLDDDGTPSISTCRQQGHRSSAAVRTSPAPHVEQHLFGKPVVIEAGLFGVPGPTDRAGTWAAAVTHRVRANRSISDTPRATCAGFVLAYFEIPNAVGDQRQCTADAGREKLEQEFDQKVPYFISLRVATGKF